MNMSKNLFLLFLLFISSLATAQEYKKEIKREFTEYLNFISNKEFEKSTEYIPEVFFECTPKEQIIKLMAERFNNPSVTIQFVNPKIGKINNSKEVEGKYYALFSYSNQMNVKDNSAEKDTKERKSIKVNYAKESFDKTFGSKNVKYNETTGFFEIRIYERVCAISENGQTNWKFLIIKEQKAVFEKLLPKEIYKKI